VNAAASPASGRPGHTDAKEAGAGGRVVSARSSRSITSGQASLEVASK
jgi:hypothetical protein